MLTAELTLKTGSREKTFAMHEGRPLFAGRTVECDLYLPAPAVSRRHAVFMARGGKCGIKDLESSNGTFLNGERITRPMRLRDGDVIQIANFVIEFKVPRGQTFGKADETLILKGRAHAAPPSPKDDDSDSFSDVEVPAARIPAAATPDTSVHTNPEPPPPPPRRERKNTTEARPAAGPSPAEAPVPAPEPKKPAPAAERASRESMRLTPRPPKAPVLPVGEAAPDEVSDGDGDANFMADAAAQEDAPDRDLALA